MVARDRLLTATASSTMAIAIIDYGMGNLRSVQKACEHVGAETEITRRPQTILEAERVILPGVGAFRDAIAELKRLDLVTAIRDRVAAGRPLLGICLGLQLLFDVSYEEGEHEGLGIVPGKVVRFDLPREYKVPHMGWNRVTRPVGASGFPSVADGEYFYFVHSYHVVPHDPSWIALEADYGGRFCAAISREALAATQFHPEKSQGAGQRLLAEFAGTSMVSR